MPLNITQNGLFLQATNQYKKKNKELNSVSFLSCCFQTSSPSGIGQTYINSPSLISLDEQRLLCRLGYLHKQSIVLDNATAFTFFKGYRALNDLRLSLHMIK